MARERVLLILGNSVSLPPVEAAPDHPVVAYPAHLQRALAPRGWRIDCRIVSGATVADIERLAQEALQASTPEAIVVQLGIVDCTPRPLREPERLRLSTLRPLLLQNLIIAFIHRYRAQIIRRRDLIQKTAIEPFRDHFHELIRRCLTATKQVVSLPIFPATASILSRNPRLAAEIDKYNDAMGMEHGITLPTAQQVFQGASIEDLCITTESVHLNQRGHALIAQYLETWLSRTTESSANSHTDSKTEGL